MEYREAVVKAEALGSGCSVLEQADAIMEAYEAGIGYPLAPKTPQRAT